MITTAHVVTVLLVVAAVACAVIAVRMSTTPRSWR